MKTIIIIESVDELLRFANQDRKNGNPDPVLPRDATLVFENDFRYIRLNNAEGFQLSDEIKSDDLIKASIQKLGINCHIT